MMGFKCAPQVIGLIRGEPKDGQKHRADGGKILREMGDERHSRTQHLDRTLSRENVFEGYESGQACWDDMCSHAEEGVLVTRKGKDGAPEQYRRKVRKDAVIGWAVVIHPADEVTEGWTWEEFGRFDRDSMDVLAEIEPRLFRREAQRMVAEHRDEKGKHRHHAGEARDDEGRYCGNLIDAKLMTKINELYPRMMRERGWEVDDMDTTDFQRARTDEAYRQERNEKRRRGRMSTNEYAMRNAAERAKEYTERAIVAQQAALDAQVEAKAAVEERDAAMMQAHAERDALLSERRDFEDEMAMRSKRYRAHKDAQERREREIDRLEGAAREANERMLEERRKLEEQYRIANERISQQEQELERRRRCIEEAELTVEAGVTVAEVVELTLGEVERAMLPDQDPFLPTRKREKAAFFPELRRIWTRFADWLADVFVTRDGTSTSRLEELVHAVERKLKPEVSWDEIDTTSLVREDEYQRDYSHGLTL